MEKVNARKPQTHREPLVSVIVTTKNEEEVLEKLLKSIKNQTYTRIETIVVDNDSSDGTCEVAKKYTDKVFIKGPERSAQRNFGAKKARGKYLLFLDADMELSSGVIKGCVELTQKDGEIRGIVIPEESMATNFWERVKAFERSFYNLEGEEQIEAARFFSKMAYDTAGGYDETITGPEDWDLPESIRKSGYKIGRIKGKIYHYERIKGFLTPARKKFYYGLKSYRYFKKQGIALMGPKTIYFLRPVFYRNWKRLFSHPILSFGMCVMFMTELFAGGAGYLIGRIKKL